MSNIYTLALRKAAERARADNHTQDEWFHYLRCSTPENVLALLDELEAEKRISTTWRKTAESNRGKLEAAEKRIAELEAREVKLPERYEVEMCPTPSPNGDWYSREDVLSALVSAGLKVAAAGKGETS